MTSTCPATMGDVHRAELADFLRRHREALQPSDAGLPPGRRRRTSGLRREEVAHLASMSVDYYTRLEQQRGPQPSVAMLTSIARALRLSDDERDYLFRLGGHNAPDRARGSGQVPAALLRVLDRLDDSPALVISSLGETLVANRLAVALFGDASVHSGWERSDVYRWFVNPATERTRYPAADHDRHSRAQVAALRAAYGSMGSHSRAGELVRELLRRSMEFTDLWDRHEVAQRFEDHKTLIHPEIGSIELDCQALFTEDQSQALLVLTAPPNSEGAQKLRLLAVLGSQSFADPIR